MDGRTQAAEVLREYDVTGPVAGVTFDGQDVWFANGEKLCALDPATGDVKRTLPLVADAGTAFDGRHFFQLSKGEILRVDPKSGKVLSRVPAPSANASGLTWAEGSLWIGMYKEKKIHRLDPETGKILHTIESTRFVTGVTFVDGDLWHGTWEGDESDIRCVDKATGEVLDALPLPAGTGVSGLEFDGKETLYAGGGKSGKVRAIRRPRRD